MATLHESLGCLTKVSWDSIPTNQDDLRAYIADVSTKARLIADSVPEPPAPENSSGNSSSRRSPPQPTKPKPSPIRLGTTDETTLAHQREWSKPIKLSNAKDNPLGIQVHKLPSADGRGDWFGRRSVHEGLPFSVWEEKLSSEMTETLRNNQERLRGGFPADQAVRGIGAEKQIEEVQVLDEKGENVIGRVNVFHVSAQFPRPTTARDFVTMIITWERTWNAAREGEGKGRAGRSWMMVSRPCEHPEAPTVQDYIRGQYESVEMIREILVDRDSGCSTPGSRSRSGSSSGAGSNHTNNGDNPVEWIMVTRSDPGGAIPRWMVEKGTPKSICSDAAKFLDWASQSDKDTRRLERRSTAKSERSLSAPTGADGSEDSHESDYSEYDEAEHHGLIAIVGQLLHAGLERYAPQAVLDYIPQYPLQLSSYGTPDSDSRKVHEGTQETQVVSDDKGAQDDASSQASLNSEPNAAPKTPGDVNLDIPATELLRKTRKGKLSSHERQLAKLAQQKRSVEARIELIRSDIQSLGLRPTEDEVMTEKAAALASADDSSNKGSPRGSVRKLGSEDRTSSSSNIRSRSGTPTTEHPEMNKVATALFREESKLLRRLTKIERHQLKEAAKIEARQRKKAEKEDKARSWDEMESLRREIESLRKECEKLKSERKQWLKLIGSLQAENTRLARQVGAEGKK
ncbi:uncharacterized protein BJX67DRAFT_217837 [Aspergillus lucknowensis]|uniref:DUF3074 domain-containing protein n=1 Tax=Aspergillus lucknowensis TaxID=176173 RepID=A0ABR4M3G0_9EURO